MATCVIDSDYKGPERRTTPDRRQQCPMHDEMRGDLHELRNDVKSKVPMRLFVGALSGTIAIAIIILGVQWGTYQNVSDMKLANANAMGDIKSQMVKITLSIENNERLNKLKDENLSEAVQRHVKSTDKTVEEIKTSITKMEQVIERKLK